MTFWVGVIAMLIVIFALLYFEHNLKEKIKIWEEIQQRIRCEKCKHPYVGLAQNCKCTNWGRPRYVA